MGYEMPKLNSWRTHMMYKRLFAIVMFLGTMTALMCTAKPDPQALVAKVGDRSYTYKTYNEGFKAYLSYNVHGRTLTAMDSIRFNDQYWSELIGIYIYDQAIKAGKVKVTNTEIERDIIANPPDGVKIIKDFQTKGVFDPKKYRKALIDRPDFKKSVIDLSRNLFTYNKLVQTIKDEAVINADSIKANWQKDNNKADASILVFDYTKLPPPDIPDAELRQYYDKNQSKFRKENGKSYQYVQFSKAKSEGADTEEQLKNMKIKASSLLAHAKESGLALAAKEAGYILEESPIFNPNDKLVPGIDDSSNLVSFAFKNPKGALSPIFYAANGDQYIFEVYGEYPEYTQDFQHQKDAIRLELSRIKRSQIMYQRALEFIASNDSLSFKDNAQRDSLAIYPVKDLGAYSIIPALGKIPAMNSAILSTPVGSFTAPVEKDRRWLTAMVSKRIVPDMAVWEKDKASIIAEATKTLKQEHLNIWYNQERDKLEIIDNRASFYSLPPQSNTSKSKKPASD